MANLPEPITEFFRLKNAEDNEGLAQLFSDDATVIDAGERKEMRGRDEITQWIEKSISGLHLQTHVRDGKDRDGEWIIDTVMTGNFKASPARFEYFISLKGDKISKLRGSFAGLKRDERLHCGRLRLLNSAQERRSWRSLTLQFRRSSLRWSRLGIS